MVVVFLTGALVGALSVAEIVPNFKGSTQTAAQGSGPDSSGGLVGGVPGETSGAPGAIAGVTGTTSTGGGIDAGGSGGSGALPPAASGLKCAPGQNGGNTDQGVTGTQIRLATTVVESGIGRPFLRDVRFAMDAVKNRVNREGGICGRKLTIEYVDDGWDPQKGAEFLGNFINEPDKSKRIFAIPVGPSSEGLRVVLSRGDVDRAQVPVVGADGMLEEQYVQANGGGQPWVWPVASATVASARIMVQNAWKSGAKTFGIVFDKNYRFGQEAAKAFSAEVRRLTKSNVAGYNAQNNCQQRYCGIQAGQSSYPNEIQEYYKQKVDFTALFLEPQTGLTWMGDPNARASSEETKYGAAQPLFTRDFADKCQDKCDQMMVWTGFKPYIESYKSDPAVRKYVADLQRTNPQADVYNAFAVGGYVGMDLLVEGLKKVGPYLTRQRLKQELDRMTLDTGLTLQRQLSWRPGWQWVNTTMQGFTILYKGTFGGWREGPIEKDPRPAAGVN
jgi:ABC-type branched-subunit amino acid transport system substrate-binding protein